MSNLDKSSNFNYESLLKECKEYFKKDIGYDRFFKLVKRKYESLGDFSGNVIISLPTNDEIMALSGIMKKNYYNKKTINIKLSKFIEKFKETKYFNIEFIDLLNVYFNEDIIPNKEYNKNKEEKKNVFFSEVLEKYISTKAYEFFCNEIENKTNIYNILIRNYKKDKNALKETIDIVCKAINNLPKKKTLISVFASNITLNPHKFDEKTLENTLIILAFASFEGLKNTEKITKLKKVELLYKYNLLIDDMSNYVLTCGLIGYDGINKHIGMNGYFKNYESIILNLQNLANIDKLKATKTKVFVFENPSVFSNVYEYFKKQNIKVSIICTYRTNKIIWIYITRYVKK